MQEKWIKLGICIVLGCFMLVLLSSGCGFPARKPLTQELSAEVSSLVNNLFVLLAQPYDEEETREALTAIIADEALINAIEKSLANKPRLSLDYEPEELNIEIVPGFISRNQLTADISGEIPQIGLSFQDHLFHFTSINNQWFIDSF